MLLSGCGQVTCISLTPEANMAAVTYGHQLCLRYVDMSDCCRLDDAGLQLVVTYCPAIVQLYVRRCPLVSDLGSLSVNRSQKFIWSSVVSPQTHLATVDDRISLPDHFQDSFCHSQLRTYLFHNFH